MKRLIIMVGLPSAGKSTRARELSRLYSAPIVCPDEVRIAVHGRPYMTEAEPQVWQICRTMVVSLFGAGHWYVILDSCASTRARRDEWEDNRWTRYYEQVVTPVQVCISRARDARMREVIAEKARRFEPLAEDEPTLAKLISVKAGPL